MAVKTQYLANKVLNHILGVAAYTAPTPYIALYTVMPTATTSGTEVASGTGYSRQSVTFSTSTTGTTSNTNLVSFGPNTTTNWGTIVGFAVVDSSTYGAGNILYFKAFTDSRTCYIGDRVEFAAGNLTVTET